MDRIDDSHHPHKRRRSLGPGPRKHPPVRQTGDWTCTRAKPTGKHYVQVCTNIETGSKRTVKLKKGYKKKYNKAYRAWAARKRAPSRSAPLPSYQCRRTKRTRCK